MRDESTVLIQGAIPKGRDPAFWALVLSELMELFAFAALYVTTEIQLWPFGVALTFSAIRLFTQFRFKTFLIVSGFLVLLFLGFQLSIRFQFQPIIAAAHVAPIALGWLGLSRAAGALWGWRLGLGFISLILASALSPDFSVTLFIISFIVSGSIALACRFLSEEFTRRGISGTLPKGFIRTSLKQSGILFLAALIIFPLIPRVQGRAGNFGGSDGAKTGYTEEVNLNEWGRVSSKGSSTAALRIYGKDGTDPSLNIPSGLLRSRVLSVLGGGRWDPPGVKLETSHYLESSTNPLPSITVVREMIGPANIPVPYGTRTVSVELYGYRWGAEKTKNEEWREGRSRNQRYTYHAGVDVGAKNLKPQDLPTKSDLYVPDSFRTERMKTLVATLFKNTKNPLAKIQELHGFYRRENFKALYAEDELEKSVDPEISQMQPLERFLFVEKSGHCELFASGFAILLRMSGVPARLVAGFRVTRNAVGDVLTIRQSDAHAWLEAYIPGAGWEVVDPTPRIMRTFAVMDWVGDTYDWASAKWTQYILNYGEGESSVRAQWDSFKKSIENLKSGKNPFDSNDSETNLYLFIVVFVAGAFLLSFTTLFFFRRLRIRKPGRKEDPFTRALIRERLNMEKLAMKIREMESSSEKAQSEKKVSIWYREYEELRFGERNLEEARSIETLKKSRISIERDLKI